MELQFRPLDMIRKSRTLLAMTKMRHRFPEDPLHPLLIFTDLMVLPPWMGWRHPSPQHVEGQLDYTA